MSAFGSIYSSLSGLFGFSKALDNASDNVANINTPGYKGRDLFFRELTRDDGNGVGVDVSGSSVRHRQGDTNATGNATDIAIDGEGFFVLSVQPRSGLSVQPRSGLSVQPRSHSGEDIVYSRSGQFQFDADGYLIDPASGYRVAALDGGNRLEDARVDRTSVKPALASTLVSFAGNLDSGIGIGESYPGADAGPIEFIAIDTLGQSHTLRLTFTRDGVNTWSAQVSDSEGIPLGAAYQVEFDQDNGAVLKGGNDFLFSYQPFLLLELSAYQQHFIRGSEIAVADGNLAAAAATDIGAAAGYSFALRSAEGAGIELSDAGGYRFDTQGYLIDPASGRRVIARSETGELVDFSIADLLSDAGSPTSRVVFSGNLDAALESGDSAADPYTLNVYDSEGNPRELRVTLTKSTNNTWSARVEYPDGNVVDSEGVISFDGDGNPTAGSVLFDFAPFEFFSALTINEILDNGDAITLATAGDLSSAGSSTIAINEAGAEAGAHFLVRDGNGIEFVQSAELAIDDDGFLQDAATGRRLAVVGGNGLIGDIDFNDFLTIAGVATGEVDLVGNLDPNDPVGTTFPADPDNDPFFLEVYDAGGVAYEWRVEMEKVEANEWRLRLYDQQGVFAEKTIAFDAGTGAISSGETFSLVYQHVTELAGSAIEDLLEASPPVNVSDGDPTTAAAISLSLDRDQSDGGAWFALRDGVDIHYAAAASLRFDAEGYLIDEGSGYRIAGADDSGQLGDINIDSLLISEPRETSAIVFSGNLDNEADTPQEMGVTLYDENGDAHLLTARFTRESATSTLNTWRFQLFDGDEAIGESQDLIFRNSSGLPVYTSLTVEYDPLNTGDPTEVNFNFSNLRAFEDDPQEFDVSVDSNNGRPFGEISRLDINDRGELQIRYSNGDEVNAAQLAVREFDGDALDLSFDLGLVEDARYGTEIEVDHIDGNALGALSAFHIDSAGAVQLSYSNGMSASGPKLAFVEPQTESATAIALDFSTATSVEGTGGDLAVDTIDGRGTGEITAYHFDQDGSLRLNYSNGASAEGPRIALFQETGNRLENLRLQFAGGEDSEGLTVGASGGSGVEVSDNDGRVAGSLVRVTIDGEGYLVATYSNGDEEKLQRLAMAGFDNKAGLNPVSGSYFVDSGAGRRLGYAGEGIFGTLASGELEQSNVDLTAEFGSIIIIQRGFQASSQALNATNDMIEKLYNSVGGN